MRRVHRGVAVLVFATALIAALAGCLNDQSTSTPTTSPSPSMSVSAPTTTPVPPLPDEVSTEQLQNEAVAALVEENGQTACDVLALKPATDVNEIVELILSTYGVESMDADTQRILAGRFIADSAAKYCPEESGRVNSDLAAG
jgi:hypothetical protein